MKVLIAPDKLKGSLAADKVASAIARGLLSVDPAIELDFCPLADGGEGFVTSLITATGGRFITESVTGPLPEMKVDATFGLLGDGEAAVIEMSAASGLALLKPGDRNPQATTTFGTGQLLLAALRHGAKKILLGIGGSATIDAGIGCCQATGHTVLLEDNEPVSSTEPLTGADLPRVLMVKRHRGEKTDGVPITVACDVTNPLYGPTGAAEVFGPQKGATPEQVQSFDAALKHFARRNGKDDLARAPGAGAAGGLGFAMMAFYGATMRRGIDVVIEAVGLRDRLRGVDLCITAEGSFDSQSLDGKTVAGVAALCKEMAIPCVVLAGAVSCDATSAGNAGVTAALSIADRPITLEAAIKSADLLLAKTAATVLRLWRAVPRP